MENLTTILEQKELEYSWLLTKSCTVLSSENSLWWIRNQLEWILGHHVESKAPPFPCLTGVIVLWQDLDVGWDTMVITICTGTSFKHVSLLPCLQDEPEGVSQRVVLMEGNVDYFQGCTIWRAASAPTLHWNFRNIIKFILRNVKMLKFHGKICEISNLNKDNSTIKTKPGSKLG